MRWHWFTKLLEWHGKSTEVSRRCPLALEVLESRLAPIVGGKFQLPILTPGTIYTDPNINNLNLDGVVKVEEPNDHFGTGSLLSDGLHVLTAAHIADGITGTNQVVFNLQPTAPGRLFAPSISIDVPTSAQTTAPGWDGNIAHGNDIAIMALTDPQTGGFLVAPYYGPLIGYPLVANGANAGIQYLPYTAVGYGLTGTGTTGVVAGTQGFKRMGVNNWQATAQVLNNEVQTVSVTGSPVGGKFTLTYTPPPAIGGQAVTTAPIPWNATAGQVQDALNALTLAGNVIVTGGANWQGVRTIKTFRAQWEAQPAISWFISFTGALANTNLNNPGQIPFNEPITIASAAGDDALQAAVGANVGVYAEVRVQGAINKFPASTLISDFDNARVGNDALGLGFGILGLGVPPVNERQTVTLGVPPAGPNPAFTLTFTTNDGLNPSKATTAPIPWNATADQIQTALNNAATPGGNTPLRGNVTVTGVGGAMGTAPFTIEFNNALSGTDVYQLTSNVPTVTISTTQNGRTDNFAVFGDSGGPGFVNGQIAGVFSSLWTIRAVPDLDNQLNGTYGELDVYTNVGSFVNNFINPTINEIHPSSGQDGAEQYPLVLDMSKQALGVDGVTDNLTITAQNNNGSLQLIVNDLSVPNSPYNGTYFTGVASDISSLTIDTGPDNVTVQLIGNLGVGPITINGSSGNNTYIIGATNGGNLDDITDTVTINGGKGGINSLIVNDAASPMNRVFDLTPGKVEWQPVNQPWVPSKAINYTNIANEILYIGSHGPVTNTNFVSIEQTNPGTTTTINLGNSNNAVFIGETLAHPMVMASTRFRVP